MHSLGFVAHVWAAHIKALFYLLNLIEKPLSFVTLAGVVAKAKAETASPIRHEQLSTSAFASRAHKPGALPSIEAIGKGKVGGSRFDLPAATSEGYGNG